MGTAAAGARRLLATWTPGRRLPPPPPPRKTATESEAEKKRDEDRNTAVVRARERGGSGASQFHRSGRESHATYPKMSGGTRDSPPRRLLLHSRLPVLRPPSLESRQHSRIKGGKPTGRNVRRRGRGGGDGGTSGAHARARRPPTCRCLCTSPPPRGRPRRCLPSLPASRPEAFTVTEQD